MTTKSRPSKQRTGLLKSTVIAGGIFATVLGTNLLAKQEMTVSAAEPVQVTAQQSNTEQPLTVASLTNSVAVPMGVVSTWKPSLVPIPTVAGSIDLGVSQATSGTPANNAALIVAPTIELPPLPSVAVPAPLSVVQPSTQNLGEVLNFELRQIPSVQIPAPVASSKSSK